MINKMHGGMYLQYGLCFVNPSLVLELEMSYGNHQCRKLPVIFLVKMFLWYLVCHWRGCDGFILLIIALWLRYNLDVATLLGNPTIKCLIGLNVVPCLGLLLLSLCTFLSILHTSVLDDTRLFYCVNKRWTSQGNPLIFFLPWPAVSSISKGQNH